jgi:hypothetical protein
MGLKTYAQFVHDIHESLLSPDSHDDSSALPDGDLDAAEFLSEFFDIRSSGRMRPIGLADESDRSVS